MKQLLQKYTAFGARLRGSGLGPAPPRLGRQSPPPRPLRTRGAPLVRDQSFSDSGPCRPEAPCSCKRLPPNPTPSYPWLC